VSDVNELTFVIVAILDVLEKLFAINDVITRYISDIIIIIMEFLVRLLH